MEVRCQNCGERLRTEPRAAAEYELTCPACAARMVVVPKFEKPRARRLRFRLPEFRRSRQQNFKKVFEPIPKPALYAAGILLALALLSPFWVYLVQETYKRQDFYLSEETTNLVTSSSSDTNFSIPLFSDSPAQTTSLEEFRGVRLETGRDDLLRRFNLRLQNARGMEPEIYAGYRLGDTEHIGAYFYNNQLKEVFLVFREPRQGLALLEQELVRQFGAPTTQSDRPNQTLSATGLGAGLGAGVDEAGELQRRLGIYPQRRDYLWATDNHRVEASIYYQSLEAQGVTISVHLAAASWLRSNQPMGGVILAPSTPPGGPSIPGPRDLFR